MDTLMDLFTAGVWFSLGYLLFGWWGVAIVAVLPFLIILIFEPTGRRKS